MKNHRFLWLRNRTTNNRKCEKARNIKEKRTIEMFSTVSKPHVAQASSPRDNRLYFQGCFITKRILQFNRLRQEQYLPQLFVIAGRD